MNYNFKKIQIVPASNDFLDIVLSKTQRKTPTVVHKGYQISRIRNFYMRKVKYTQETFDEKISQILHDFPKLDDIHPFYADLMNVLYDRDHYKLALGQLNTAKHLIDSVGKEYLKLLKFGDSLYRCKHLKRAALGRMATIIGRQKDSLSYLEQIRQHLARLPSIDPNTRTLLITGFPNVGKSSFMNRVSRAEVEVQPYAFTTKSLFVGHFDYNYLRWQVIDTPGILDHPLEERNTIEMLSITALAHIRAAILYFFDISENCGHSIEQQLALFNSIKPLFANKPILLVANKCDLIKLKDLSEENQAAITSLLKDNGQLELDLIEASTITDEGVMDVRNRACEKLLSQRIEYKLKNGSKVENILNKLHVTLPKARDEKERPPCIPNHIVRLSSASPLCEVDGTNGEHSPINDARMIEEERKLECDLEQENGGAGVYSIDLKRHYLLSNEQWKYDPIPEIWNGKNVADFIDPDIEAKLLQLELEEEEKEGRFEYAVTGYSEEQKTLHKLSKDVSDKRSLIQQRNRLVKSKSRQAIPMKKQSLKKKRRVAGDEFDSSSDTEDRHSLSTRMDLDAVVAPGRRSSTSRSRSVLGGRFESSRMSERSQSRVRDRSLLGFKDEKSKASSDKMIRKAQTARNQFGRQGEADRHISDSKPKHLYSGKRKAGTHDYR